MKKSSRPIFNKLVFSAVIIFLILLMQPFEIFLFKDKIPILFPKGWVALEQRNLLIFVQILMLLIIIPVYIFTFLFSWWYRADNEKAKYDPHLTDSTLAEIVWWGVPTVMLVIVSVITWIETHNLDPYRPLESEQKPLTVQAIALEWKWLFIYPEEGVASLNYLHLPVDRPVHFLITADAPMNTFWIPRLGGQIYAMPGMQTELHLIANEPGNFRGSSGHVSGEGFSKMYFRTEATSAEEHEAWVAAQQSSATVLDAATYDQIAEPSIDHPVASYRMGDTDLYIRAIHKYMMPPHSEKNEG